MRDTQLPTSRTAIRAYFESMPGPHRAVVESTSNWYWLHDLLVGAGVDLRLGHSKYIKAISYAKVKTDAVDAATLAQLLRSGLIPEAHMVSPEWREARDLLCARLQFVGQQIRVKNTVAGLLAQYNVASPAALPPLVQLRTRLLAEQFALLGTQGKRLAAELNPLLIPTPDVQRLRWIPGIGRTVAFTILLEVDGIARFPSARDFVSSGRLVPGGPLRCRANSVPSRVPTRPWSTPCSSAKPRPPSGETPLPGSTLHDTGESASGLPLEPASVAVTLLVTIPAARPCPVCAHGALRL